MTEKLPADVQLERAREVLNDLSDDREFITTQWAEAQSQLDLESERLRTYLALTERRTMDVYATLRHANRFLLFWGSFFLFITLALVVIHVIEPSRAQWQLIVVTGAIGLLQVVVVFFSTRLSDLQRDLNNLATLQMLVQRDVPSDAWPPPPEGASAEEREELERES